MLQGRHRRPDIQRLIERGVELHVRGHPAQLGDGGANRIHRRDGVGPRLFEHAQKYATLAVDPHDLGLIRGSVLDRGNVGNPDHALALAGRRRRRAHNHMAQGAHVGNLGVGEHVVVVIAGAQAATGQEQVGHAHRVGEIEDANPACPHRAGIRHDLDLANLAAPHRGAGHAGNALELWLDGVVGQIVELLLVE